MPHRKIARWSQAHLWFLPALMSVTLVAFTIAGYALLTRGNSNAQARAALCVLEKDLQQRITAGQMFLKQHPEGIQGISAALIRTSIQNQQATYKALHSTLSC